MADSNPICGQLFLARQLCRGGHWTVSTTRLRCDH